MSIINSNYLTNNLSSLNLNSISTASLEHSNKISTVASKIYLGPSSTKMPGLTNIFYAPYELYLGIKASYEAYKIGDKEGIFENGLRIIQAPLCFSNALLQLSWYAIYGGIFLNIINAANFSAILQKVSPLSISIAAVGFAICAIEGALETVGLVRTVKFFKENYLFDTEELKNSLTIQDPRVRQVKFYACLQKILQSPLPAEIKNEIESLIARNGDAESDFFQLSAKIVENKYLMQLRKLHSTYFQISSKKMLEIDQYVQNKLASESPEEQLERRDQIIQANFAMKKRELERRVHPWLANKIENSLPQILQDLESPEQAKRTEAKEKAALIFKNIKIQSQKKLLIHTIGLIAVLITVAGLIAGCLSCPFMIPFILLLLGGILACVRYNLHRGLMDSEGWDFSVSNCIPDIIKQIYKMIFEDVNPVKPKSYSPPVLTYVLPNSRMEAERRRYEASLPRINFKMRTSYS